MVVAVVISIGLEYTFPTVFVGSVPSVVYLIASAEGCSKDTVVPAVIAPEATENVGCSMVLVPPPFDI